jgi:predicted ABC-type ATPase
MLFEFVNADEIARGSTLESNIQAQSDISAGRIMLDWIDELAETGGNFVIETTLASLTYARKIPKWRERGYSVSLIYLRLASATESIARVRKRVEAGGHSIPEKTIRRRFNKSLAYFETIYKPTVDVWFLLESREGGFVLIDSRRQQ